MRQGTLTAVVWDFDGTLVDTRRRNYNVVRRVLTEVVGSRVDDLPALRSPEAYDQVNRGYANWRDLYTNEFGLSEAETDRVGRTWTRYQLEDDTPAPVFDGVAGVLAALRFVPHGVVSMNGRPQIARSLREANLHERFACIVGWEDVDIRRQKPEPDALLQCLQRLTGLEPGTVLYVGDHETDARCAANAERVLAERGAALSIVTVAAGFAGQPDVQRWSVRPDHTAQHPHDIIDVARQLYTTA